MVQCWSFLFLTWYLFYRPGLGPVITGYLPSAILSGFIYIIPFAMLAMAKLAGYVSRSKKDIKSSNMVFYFLVGNVFFLSLLSGSLIDHIGESFTHPKDFPSRLASAVSAQVSLLIFIDSNGMFCSVLLLSICNTILLEFLANLMRRVIPIWRAYETSTSLHIFQQ